MTGSFKGTATFGHISLTSGRFEDIFLVKYEPDGKVVWARKAGGTSWDFGRNVAVDAAGNSYVTGHFLSATAAFDLFTVKNTDINERFSDIFLAKYDADGKVVWVKSVGSRTTDFANGIALDAAGNSYITGTINGTPTFGTTTLNTGPNSNLFVVKFNPVGEVAWAIQAGSFEQYDNGHSIAVDAAGNGYVTGDFSFTAAFDPFKVTMTGQGNDLYIAKFGPIPVPVQVIPTEEPPLPEEKAFIPNIITPNGDGLNDTFVPRIPGMAIDLKVYNRWGYLVYEKVDYRNQWDGGNLPDSTYYYLLTSASGQNWKGWVEICR